MVSEPSPRRPQWVKDFFIMPTRFLKRSAALDGGQTSKAGATAVYVDSDNDIVTYTTGATGTTEEQLVGRTLTQTLTNKTLTAPVIGAATGTSLAATGAITSSSASAGVGYATGAGSTVTQITSRTTGVTVNAISGAITTDSTSLAAGAEAAFTVTNSSVAVGDVIVLSSRSGETAGTSVPIVSTVAAGSFEITLTNLHATTADTGAMIINFAVIKAVSA